ncbi:hypothetical protein L6164_010264 [Bauhinia variegata]|uniref:Uncharacterized protein n=1 Tax=Bauhinia variegata TaxID=167791 RepID=A0ACB9PMG2_BAUVA|nr:hypothetical protein L6164_010264 [Bauhinia variegata]
MSNSGGSAVMRTHGSDRFYNPPAVRRNQQLLEQQQLQKQLQRPLKSDRRVDPVEPDTLTDSDESALSRPSSACSFTPPRTANLTILDRLIASVTPFVPAKFLTEPRMKGWRTPEADGEPYFCLEDLWESVREWSAYGVTVSVNLNGINPVKQYYVPLLSAIQVYIEPRRLRKLSEDSDTESLKETSSVGSNDCEMEKRTKGGFDVAWPPLNLINANARRLSKLTLLDRTPMSSSIDESEVCNSPGLLAYEFIELDRPHVRKPFHDKVNELAEDFPDLKKYRSCDLLPSSWFSVAWYPIYRIPVGSTLKNVEASFLTYHPLSTHPRGKNQPQFHASSGKKVHGVDASPKFSLPVFGLASYKLKDSILTSDGPSERQQEKSLFQAAEIWLRHLDVNHHDFRFFNDRNSQRR